jgi:hypothetical protein
MDTSGTFVIQVTEYLTRHGDHGKASGMPYTYRPPQA